MLGRREEGVKRDESRRELALPSSLRLSTSLSSQTLCPTPAYRTSDPRIFGTLPWSPALACASRTLASPPPPSVPAPASLSPLTIPTGLPPPTSLLLHPLHSLPLPPPLDHDLPSAQPRALALLPRRPSRASRSAEIGARVARSAVAERGGGGGGGEGVGDGRAWEGGGGEGGGEGRVGGGVVWEEGEEVGGGEG